jgi:hypothetical protein
VIAVAPWIVAHTGLRDTAISSILASPSVTTSSDRASFSWFVPLSISAILLAVLIAAAPWIVAHTGLRDRTINSILASPNLRASSSGASFAWFASQSVSGLHLNSTNNHVDVRVEGITVERTPWQLWRSGPELGTIKAEKPHVTLELPLDIQIQKRHNRLEPTLTATVKDAGLTVRHTGQDEPVIDVDAIDMTLRIEKAEEGRVLNLDPVLIFDRRKLSPKLANRLLHLFDPTMSDITQTSGAVSLSVDRLCIPIGVPSDRAFEGIAAEGKLVLHDVSAETKNVVAQALAHLVADMNGREASGKVRLAKDDEVRFQVRDGRLHHGGLRIGFPDIDPELVLTSRGSVGLDETLDLFVDLPRLDKALRREKVPAKCHISGSVRNPKITVEDGSLVLRQHNHKEPIIAADGINLNMQVENTTSGRVLAVEPIEVFKKTKLDLGVASGLLKLLAPDVQGDRQVAGEISLSFSKLRIPLAVARDRAVKQLEAEGQLTLHQVASDVKSPMWQALVRVLADMNGKQPAAVIRLVADAEIPFQVRNGRLYHDGMRVGFPDIDPELVISSHGSIGLDETLDLFMELPRLDGTLRKEKGPARCHITGTISNPRITVEDGSLVLRQHSRKEPIIAAEGINLNMQVENTATGRVLSVEPFEVFQKTKLNLAVASGLLKLLAPDVVDTEREVTGEVSLSLNKVRFPLGIARDKEFRQLEATGRLTLHQVASEVKSPLWRALIRFLADLNGKQPADVIRLVADAEIHFQLRDGRLRHYGYRIGFPEIDPELVVSSRGSIGVDGTLNLYLEMPRLRKQKRDKSPFKCHVTGTIHEPTIAILNAPLLVKLGISGCALKAYAVAFRTYRLTGSLRRAARWTFDKSCDLVLAAPSIFADKKGRQIRKAARSDTPSCLQWSHLGPQGYYLRQLDDHKDQ